MASMLRIKRISYGRYLIVGKNNTIEIYYHRGILFSEEDEKYHPGWYFVRDGNTYIKKTKSEIISLATSFLLKLTV